MQCLCTKAPGGIPKNSAVLERLIMYTDFLHVEVNLPEFQGSEPTTHFIKMVDMAFD